MATWELQVNDILQKAILIMFLSVFLNFLFGCKQPGIAQDDLIGVWQGEKQNGKPIKNIGFNSIKLTFANDSVEVIIDMNAFGGHVTTKSAGTWELNKNIIKTRFGDHSQECLVNLNDETKTIIFKPDLFFKSESVRSSEYKKAE